MHSLLRGVTPGTITVDNMHERFEDGLASHRFQATDCATKALSLHLVRMGSINALVLSS